MPRDVARIFDAGSPDVANVRRCPVGLGPLPALRDRTKFSADVVADGGAGKDGKVFFHRFSFWFLVVLWQRHNRSRSFGVESS